MIEKNIKSRIQQKHDIEANWLKAKNFIPMRGELIVYDIDENYDYERLKIGDGTTSVVDLPFAGIPSDWNQNDETQSDYIKNRTHYIIPDAISVPPTQVNVDGAGYIYYVGQFEEGKTYNVVFDGTTYPCVWNFVDQTNYQQAYMGNGNMIYTDIEDTGEPFVFIAFSYYGFPVYGIRFKESGTHTVGIEGYFEPTPITITSQYEVGFSPALVSGNTYKVKWNGAEYILTAFTIDGSDEVFLGNSNLLIAPPSSERNEPFCFNYSPHFGMLGILTSEKQENTFSIEGILPEQTRKFNIELSYQYMTDIDTIWQQGLEENKEYTVILDGEEYNCICKYNYDFEDLCIGSEKLFYPLRTLDDYPFVITSEGFCATKGTHKISIREDLAVKIDKKFLPPLVGKKILEVKGAEVFNDYSYNSAYGEYSHAEGARTFAIGESSHAEGYYTAAFGNYSHAEGFQTNASGDYSHAEGNNTTASGSYSHAEGISTKASGRYSHTEGNNTKASSNYQHVQGRHNIEDTEDKYAHIVGNGNSSKSSNSHTLDWEGNAWYQGDVYVGSTSGTNRDDGSKKLATEEYVDNALENINIEGLDDMVQINLDGAVEGETSLANAGTLNGKTEEMLSVLRAAEAENAENANTLGGKVESELSVANAVNANNANTLEGHSVNSLINKIYPIGSIYMSVNSVSPDVLFGGTWEALQDRFLLGAGSTYSAGSTGGEATHKHTDGDLRAMIGAVNNNTGSIGYMATSAHNPNTGVTENVTMAINGSTLTVKGTNHYTRVVGYTSMNSNIPPYLSVYMWKRTA